LLGEAQKVYATGYSHLQKDVEDVTISILDFPSGVGAHIYLSWMNPFKEHRLVILGDKKMAVFEDSRPENKLRIFNNSFEWVARRPVPVKGSEEVVETETSEPLSNECVHFLDCVVSRRKPTSDGEEGLRVLQVLQECYESMKSRPLVKNGGVEESTDVGKNFSVHGTAVVDESASIGLGTQIWHFSHVMKGAQIGKNCRIGQNCFIGKGVRIGDNCKIQNNVSVYEGITLEDNVFCGPSMVFTNVYNPRCEIPRMNELRKTVVSQGATIGANSTILCGTSIGKFAFIGAGAVVLKDVADYGLMVGNPAKRVGWMCRCGIQLKKSEKEQDRFACPSCGATYRPTGANLVVCAKAEEIRAFF
jgi:UDP-2-acetamido-3-amino-2,3-dideoxy-glucuronate N-acetyltransferase